MTFKGNFDQLASLIIDVADLASAADGPTVIAVGGYPCTGKTRLAAEIASRWRASAFLLPTESVIATRRTRLALSQDGSSLDAHDVKRLLEFIKCLRHRDVIHLPRYSWESGLFVGTVTSPRMTNQSLVIVDGSIATASPVWRHVDAAFALRPEPRDLWLAHAVDRDVRERSWSAEVAEGQNVAKAQTVEDQLTEFVKSPFQWVLTITVDGTEWLATDEG